MAIYFQFLATLCCAVFVGASIYVNLIEHPARMSCGAKVALAEWASSYHRATVVQASPVIFGFLFSAMARFLGADIWIFVAGILLGAVAPFTLICIMPTNNRLSLLNTDNNENEIISLLTRWNRLHAIRSALSCIALVLFLGQAFNVRQ